MTDSKTLTVDDLFRFQWLQVGKFSPDGKQVAYTVTHIEGEGEDEKEYSTLYLLDVATGAIRKMTGGKNKDTSPEWSPDGKHIAFVSDRGEKGQIYLLPIDGGEAQQLTELEQGAGAPVWSPDGTTIAFTAGKAYDDDDKKPDRSKEPYMVTRNIWRFDAIGDIELSLNDVYTVDVASKDVKQLSTDTDSLKNGLMWSPDSQQLLYTSNMLPDRWLGFNSITTILDRDGNELHTLDLGYLSPLEWLGNERLLMAGNYDTDAIIGTHGDLYVVDIESGEMDNRTQNLEMALLGGVSGRAPAYGQWMPYVGITDDGQSAYMQVQVGGEVGIYRFALQGEIVAERVVMGERACYLQDMQGDHLLLGCADIVNTPNLYIAKTDGSDERQLTHLNEELLADYPTPEFQKLDFTGTDGADVEGWYVKPTDGSEGPYPTILWIHGGPHAAQGYNFAYDTQLLTAAGYGVLYVNHRASTGYGDSFSTAIQGDWGVLDYGDLMAGVDYAIELGLADADQLGCCGISGGGNLSTWIIGQTDRFKAAVPQNPVTNWQSFYGVSDIGVWFSTKELGGHPHEIPEVYDRCSPITYAHNCTTPTLMIQCEHDWRCPPEQSEQYYTVLRANGCTVKMLRQPGGSHGGSIRGPLPLRKANLQHKLDWFNQYILGIEPSSEEDTEATSQPEPVAGD